MGAARQNPHDYIPVPVLGECLYAEAKGKIVSFPNMHAAARWVMPDRPKTAVQQIRACLTGKQKTAYMIRWKRA